MEFPLSLLYCKSEAWLRMQQIADLRCDPVKEVSYLLGQPPGVVHEGVAQAVETGLAPEVQPEEGPGDQPQQSTQTHPTPDQEAFEVQALLDSPGRIFDSPTPVVGLDEPPRRTARAAGRGADQQQQR